MQIDLAMMETLRTERLVNIATDPYGALFLANYTPKTQYDQMWDTYPLLLECRGIVYRADGTVVARPLRKFFNVGERPGTTLEELTLLGTPEVSVKLDGSMITAWFDTERDRVRLATRGSFISDQAKAAEALWFGRYANVELDPAYTYIFEYTAPDNRIVVAYADAQLTLIGLVSTENGAEASYTFVRRMAGHMGVPGVAVEDIDWATADALERSNFEGFVLRFPNGTRVKVKLSEYVRLHRLITGLNERTIWEALHTDTLEEIRSKVPEELLRWLDRVADELNADYAAHMRLVRQVIEPLGTVDPKDREQRKQAAAHIGTSAPANLRGACFMVLDGKDPAQAIWKILEPHGVSTNELARRAES